MNGPSMAPRSYAYSGGERVPTYGVAMGTEPQSSGGGGFGGFLRSINDIAGALTPLVDAARSFKAGYQGLPLPGRSPSDSRMAGDSLIFQVYQQMLDRNEREAAQARQDRENARQRDFQNQIIMEGLRKDKIPFEKALEALKSGEFDLGALTSAELSSPAAPAAPAP